MKWNCKIPGPKGSPWEAAIYKLIMNFPQDYPLRPPKCNFANYFEFKLTNIYRLI